MGRDTWDTRGLTDGARADAVELLPCLRAQRLYLGIVKSLGDEDVLQALELLGLLTLTLDIAAVLDEDLGTLGVSVSRPRSSSAWSMSSSLRGSTMPRYKR